MKHTNIEIPPRVLAKLRTKIGTYHAQLEELIRVLEALRDAGLVLAYKVKPTTAIHDKLEAVLSTIDRGEFDLQKYSQFFAQWDDGRFPDFSPDSAFEVTTGRAVQQLRKVQQAQHALASLLYEDSEVEAQDVPLEPDDLEHLYEDQGD